MPTCRQFNFDQLGTDLQKSMRTATFFTAIVGNLSVNSIVYLALLTQSLL
jgi:hypothetical protein